MPSKKPKVSPRNSATSTDPKWSKSEVRRKENTVSYTSIWTVGNALSCAKCGKATDYIFAKVVKGPENSGTAPIIHKSNQYIYARCLACLPTNKWTVSKWVEVVKGVATDISLTMFLGWLLLMSLAAVFTLIYAAVTVVKV